MIKIENGILYFVFLASFLFIFAAYAFASICTSSQVNDLLGCGSCNTTTSPYCAQTKNCTLSTGDTCQLYCWDGSYCNAEGYNNGQGGGTNYCCGPGLCQNGPSGCNQGPDVCNDEGTCSGGQCTNIVVGKIHAASNPGTCTINYGGSVCGSYYSCSSNACILNYSHDNDGTCGRNACSSDAQCQPTGYSCSNNSCVSSGCTVGTSGCYSDSACGGACQPPLYGCVGTTCTQLCSGGSNCNGVNGTTASNCGGTCTGEHYSCSGSSCIQSSCSGGSNCYTTTNCNSACGGIRVCI